MVRVERQLTLSQQTAILAVLGLVAGTLAFVTVTAAILPPACDWHRFYVPAIRAVWRGESPYAPQYGFFNPPWALALLVPFGADEAFGRAGLFVLAILTVVFAVHRLEGGLLSTAAVLLSLPMLNVLWDGNIDWLVLMGLLLPPRWGLFFAVVKPQVGAGVAIWWTVEAWRAGGWRGVWDLLWPVSATCLGSLVLFGLWPLRATDPVMRLYNTSLWPWSIPGGLVLLGWGVWKREVGPALAAAPLLSPHVILHSWLGVFVALVRHPAVLAVVVAGSWIVVICGL
jgi:hypothetical protein